MSDFSRRNVLGGAAGGMLAAVAASEAAAQGQPPSGPTPKVLAGNELPSFRFPLGAQKPKTFDGGWAKEATVAEFPGLGEARRRAHDARARRASRAALARQCGGVGLCDHGPCRVTTIDPQGKSEWSTSAAGDVWYFPRGHGHSIQGIGRENCQFVLVFDNGYFSEFGTFSITDWIGHTPREVLAKTFGVPAETFARLSEGGGLHRQGSGAAAACRPSPRPDR